MALQMFKFNRFWWLWIVCLAVPVAGHAVAGDCVQTAPRSQQKQDLLRVNLIGIGAVTTWGVVNWDYFSNSPRSTSEGWFANDTDSGGADKLGHLYTSYVVAHGLSSLYQHWCFSQQDAAFYGALSSLAILGYMELGDAFSDYGFSREDFIANSAGALLGYYLYKSPALARKLDLRWEYGLNPNDNDFVTDYENSKYLFALKLNGFDSLQDSWLRHIELQLGYYTRGFDDATETRKRNLYFGIGINLTDLFTRHGYKKTGTVLRYLQIPGSNVEFKRDINQ